MQVYIFSKVWLVTTKIGRREDCSKLPRTRSRQEKGVRGVVSKEIASCIRFDFRPSSSFLWPGHSLSMI